MSSALKIDTKNRKLAFSAVTGALYAVLTILLAPISYGPIQFRISEALCVLPYFVPETAMGLFVGCLLSNIYTGNIFDIIFGSLATLLAAFITWQLPKNGIWKFFAPLPSVICNALVISAVITFGTGAVETGLQVFAANALSIALPQAIVCYGAGLPLLLWLNKSGMDKRLFG